MPYEATTGAIPAYPDLPGKVTGGPRGIGDATCRLLAENGARVAVNGREEAAIEAVVGEIRSDGGDRGRRRRYRLCRPRAHAAAGGAGARAGRHAGRTCGRPGEPRAD